MVGGFDPELGHLALDYPGVAAVRPRAQWCSGYVGQELAVQAWKGRRGATL